VHTNVNDLKKSKNELINFYHYVNEEKRKNRKNRNIIEKHKGCLNCCKKK